ncbi:hypothetical protein P168DRAFT_311344 [Aspergillus campestris IBT 28561]|uniref:HNH nuclease domain-containing protein n=1 Tax=Aspergillus campestris (strain IBT 28561) TaxID=1392248 RepID=A0A2I1D1R8_ASPC2|nr:uncharacterized protein P168DRAFT_311344 [Aspergillus campestris IBT 28561]PKY03798.1 hypothetical protein P168DRAFT_311344 [Aspergillus campestris IBT 28561]
MSALENIPPLYVPKKRPAKDMEKLQDEMDKASNEQTQARKKLKAHGSFDAEFWSAAVNVESACLTKSRIASDISLSEFEGRQADWEKTEEARRLFAQIRAQMHRVASFSHQRDSLSLCKSKGGLITSFMKLFTSSPLGLNIRTGAGPRDSKTQSSFRAQLLKDYDSLDEQGNAWCPILGCYLDPDNVTASHLFAYKHGQASMDAIFGKICPPELFSSRNGLIMSAAVEKVFDIGVLVIVPDIPDRPTKQVLCGWVNDEVREFKIRIIDTTWSKLDHFVVGTTRWRDMDGKKLEFRGNYRPAARYLYFHYCVQILRRAWRAGPGQQAVFSLQDELGKLFWGTPGKYVARNMLKAFIQELGHEADDLLIGARGSGGDDKVLLNIAATQIAEQSVEEEDGEDEHDEDEEEDEDEDED